MPSATPRTLALAILLAALSACDSKKSESGGSGSGSSSSEKPSKPVGKPLADKSQLIGRWVRDDQGDILGIEFGEDGKAIVTLAAIGPKGAIIFDYATMDGGRVRLTPSSGVLNYTQVFTCSIKDPNMTFEPESEDLGNDINHTSKFVRLKKGETLAGVMKARAEEENKRQQEILTGARAVVSQSNLALVNADPKMNLDKFALELKGSGDSYTGVAYWAGRVVVARQAQLYFQHGSPGQPPVANLTLGNVVGPPGMQQMPGETFNFKISGEGSKVDISGGGRALRADSDTYKSITERFKKEAEARLAKMNQFADQFGAFCRLDGLMRYPGNPNAQPTRMVLGLVRVEGKPGFMFADMGRDSNPLASAFNQGVDVVLTGEEQPVLSFGGPQFIAASSANDGSSFQGAMSGMQGEFKIGERLSKDDLAKRHAAIADLLDKQMGAGITLRGLHYESDLPEPNVLIFPVQFELKTNQRNLSGTLHLHSFAARCEISGKAIETLLGARFEVDATKVAEDKYGTLRGRHTTYKFTVEWADGRPTFRGIMGPGGSNGNHTDVALSTPELLKQDRDSLIKAISAGNFIARGGGSMPARPPSPSTSTAKH